MILLAWLFGLIALIVAIAIGVAFLNRFYRKTSRDVALIRTGFGGQKIVLTGGTLALPFLHKVDEINMRTMRIEVSRAGAKSLITEDRMRVDVELEFYLRVQPTVDGVATAAQAIGSKSLSPDGVRNLLEGRFIDAIQATAARPSRWTRCTTSAPSSCARSANRCARTSAHSGLQLESVSLTRMDQAAFASLDDNNAFNAVGLRKLAEIIATSKKKRAEIEADADVSVRQTQLEAIKQRLEPLAPGRGGADRPAPRDREAQGDERRRHRAGARAVDGGLRRRAHRAREGDAGRRDPEAARAEAARDRGAAQLRGEQDRQLDRDGAEARRGGARAGRRPSSRAPRSCSRRSSCRPSASAPSPTARARSRSSASRSAARSRPRRPRARPRCC